MGERLVRRLTNQKRVLLTGYIGVALLYGLCILMLLVDKRVSIVLVNVATVLYFFVMRTLDRRYNRHFAMATLQLVCEKQLDEVTVRSRGTITGEELSQCGLFPVRSRGGAACGISLEGKKGEARIRIGELTICFDREQPDAKSKVGILDGVWMELTRPVHGKGSFTLVPETAFKKGVSPEFYERLGLKEFPIRKKDMDRNFNLYGSMDSDEKAAEEFLRSCKRLMKAAAGNGVIIRKTGGQLCIFLIGRRLTFDTPVRGKITEDIVSWNRLPEITELLEFI